MATKTVTVDRVQLVSPLHAGKALTLPHSEFSGDDFSTNKIVFDAEGVALVTENQADAVEEFYPKQTVRGKTVRVNFEVEVPDEVGADEQE